MREQNNVVRDNVTELDFEERRRDRRFGLEHRGHLVLGAYQEGVECQIINISARGARLQLADSVSAKSAYMLYVPGAGDYLPAQTMWQSGQAVGVEFRSRPTLAYSKSPI